MLCPRRARDPYTRPALQDCEKRKKSRIQRFLSPYCFSSSVQLLHRITQMLLDLSTFQISRASAGTRCFCSLTKIGPLSLVFLQRSLCFASVHEGLKKLDIANLPDIAPCFKYIITKSQYCEGLLHACVCRRPTSIL